MMDIYYENSKGDRLNLLEQPYCLQTADIFDKSWAYSSVSTRRNRERIDGFTKEVESKMLVLSVIGKTPSQFQDALNRFQEVTEYDILKASPGRLWAGDYYLPCYVLSSVKVEWEYDIDMLDNEIEIISDYPFWCRERPFSFRAGADVPEGFLDYPYNHAYDYAPPSNMRFLHNDHYYDCDFKCTVYGPCEDPRFMINDHVYEVRALLYDHEYLTFDSRDKSLVKTDYQGRRSNIFNSRNKEHDLFCKIPPGSNNVTWNLGFDFDITLFQERSEPRW